jgi:hypothetical protein
MDTSTDSVICVKTINSKTDGTMTPNKRLHSTSSRHRSLVSSQSYDSAVRRIVTDHTPNSSATKQQRGSVSRSASSKTKAREERDSYNPITPRGSETVKQYPKTTGNRTNSKYNYSDEFFEELKTPAVANASMPPKSKDHLQELRKVVEGKDILLFRYTKLESLKLST